MVFLLGDKKQKGAENKIRLGKLSLKMWCGILDWSLEQETEQQGNMDEIIMRPGLQ